MTSVSFDVPDDAVRAIVRTPGTFTRELRLAAAMFWYGRGELSLEIAAEIAGLDLRGFLSALSAAKQDILVVDMDDVREELATVAGRDRHDVNGG